MKILLTSTSFHDTPGKHQELLKAQGFLIDTLRGPIFESDLIPIIKNYDAVICGDDEYTRKVLTLGKGGNLKYISKYGVGLDKIDLVAAKELGIPVSNCPGVNQVSVAEHVLALLLSFEKNIHTQYQTVQNGSWKRRTGNEIFGRTIGIIGLGAIGDGFSIVLYVLLVGVFGIIGSMSSALGEEIGWRGFLVPELYKTQGFTKTSLISGLIWGVWHLPILLFADYNSGTPAWFGMTCFMVLVISISFVYTWFRMKSGSLWTAVILHASHNLFIQSIFTPLTEDTGNTAYYIDEFGVVLPIIAIGFAIYFWNKRKELTAVPSTL